MVTNQHGESCFAPPAVFKLVALHKRVFMHCQLIVVGQTRAHVNLVDSDHFGVSLVPCGAIGLQFSFPLKTLNLIRKDDAEFTPPRLR